MKKILIADSLDKESIEQLKGLKTLEVTVKTGMDEAALVQAIPDFNAIVVRSATKVTRPVIEAGKNLELIIRAGIGLDNIDAAAAKDKGIKVANTPAATSITVAEHAFGMMLGAVRQHGKANLSMKAHKWEKKSLSGTELYQKTLGLIGVGRIGQELARRAIAFGMKVVGYDIIPFKTDLAIRPVSLDELLAQADVISLHIPLTDQSRHMISDKEFEKMKAGVIIVNAARGGTVDEKALLTALNSGKVRAAALDVFEKEPPEDFSLIDHPNVTALPHIGAAAEEGQARAGMEVVKILKEKMA
ncbi:MAG: 3-phosphoglycerate dehydrogenase [Candidatus Aminicenantes bacterium RBG_13_63_10]|nr:MAG: 3-phosphoglycerate dehydrogenase [Candidatus Aminicenantes bacterium RBG_13_63_10]